ncbi:MAG TPA: DUF5671 domain-containing protein [Chloroflexota bacterium]|nr:DUF5671 domain-containing protein [Chloroflexota bacterium]
MATTRRVYLYGIALVALGMLVAGLASLLELLLQTLVAALGGLPAAVGPDQARGRVSYAAALSAIGLVAWVVHWTLANRPLARAADAPAERRAAIRKLFLYLVLLVGGLRLTFALSDLVRDLLRALFGRLAGADLLTGSVTHPVAVVAIVGVFWLYYARVARADRAVAPEAGAGATLRRWYVYALAFVGLLLLLFGTVGALEDLWAALVVPPGAVQSSAEWLGGALAGRLGAVAAGLAAWYLAWSASVAAFERPDEPDPESRSTLRKVYLYLVLAVAVAWTVWNLGRTLYVLLRVALVPERLAGGWGAVVPDLGGPLVTALVFGVAWAYHARVVEHEAARAGERRRQAAIRWFYAYLVALVGLGALAVGLGGTLATLLDLAVQPGAPRETHWWADRISLFATLVAVGLPLWAAYWQRLQREAQEPLARDALVRRIYLFLVFGLAVLTLLGSGAFALYQLLRRALGDTWSAGATSELLAAASAAAVAALFLAYHLRVLRAGAPPLAPPGALPATPPGAAPRAATPAAPAGPAAPRLALAVVRAADPARLAAFERELAARLPAGVELELLPLDAATAARLLAAAASP